MIARCGQSSSSRIDKQWQSSRQSMHHSTDRNGKHECAIVACCQQTNAGQQRTHMARPSSITQWHWIVLAFACLMVFGNYYCYDIPAALNVPLQKWLGSDYAAYQTQLNLLYSIYSLPNIVLPLVGGILVDALSPSLMIAVFATMVCVGQLLFTLGVAYRQFGVMLAGRFLFGVGGESLEVASSSVITVWFGQSGLAFALGMNLASARSASATNDNVSPRIAAWVSRAVYGDEGGDVRRGLGTAEACWVGVGVTLLSLACGIGLNVMNTDKYKRLAGFTVAGGATPVCDGDRDGEREPLLAGSRVGARSGSPSKQVGNDHSDVHDTDDSRDDVYHDAMESQSMLAPTPDRADAAGSSSSPATCAPHDRLFAPQIFIVPPPGSPAASASNLASATLPAGTGRHHSATIDQDDADDATVDGGYESEEYDETDETIHFSQMWRFKTQFWLLFLTTIFMYGSVTPFFHVCTDFFQQKWYSGDTRTAGMVMSIPDTISTFGSPICGMLLDAYGHRSTMLPLSTLLIFAAHGLMAFTTWPPWIGMAMLGVAVSLYASALWPCVPYLVGRHQIATAYGLLTVGLNMSLFTFPLVVAEIRKRSRPDDFVGMEVFFMAMSVGACLFSCALLVMDWRHTNGSLMKPSYIATAALSATSSVASTPVRRGHGRECVGSQDSTGTTDAGASDLQPTDWPTDDDDEEDDNDMDSAVTAKVIGDGLVVLAPATVVHHHHQIPYHTRSPTIGPSSSTVASAQSQASGSQRASPRFGPSPLSPTIRAHYGLSPSQRPLASPVRAGRSGANSATSIRPPALAMGSPAGSSSQSAHSPPPFNLPLPAPLPSDSHTHDHHGCRCHDQDSGRRLGAEQHDVEDGRSVHSQQREGRHGHVHASHNRTRSPVRRRVHPGAPLPSLRQPE
ncbi:major facilitator superfamily domain-containing protein [Entophlyctis helioformis]|nr:major facilitator superfamily domain-containing protein [Entophlyctis helioformis]